jgi:threonyl-tRNA synthetase
MLDSNDHRSIAQRLDLFHFQEEAPGMVFWHPRGFTLYRLLEDAVRKHIEAEGYAEIRTPQILRKPVWEASGHWQHFQSGMFTLADEEQPAAVKPVSCPGHVCFFGRRHPSYRELPLRYAEFGVVHRDEPSGTLHGLLRLRQFTQDDGHIFCTPEQAVAEVVAFCRGLGPFYRKFGFEEPEVVLATRPSERAGEQPGGGAFYGPKLEFVLKDRLGRAFSCGTIQFDLVMPRRFDIRYIDERGEREVPVMLHRALYGSLERFMGMLLEHHGAELPPWLCPEQVLALPVKEEQAGFGRELLGELQRAGIRASLDARNETLSRRIAEGIEAALPFIAVVGAREAEARNVTIRYRDGASSTRPLREALGELRRECASPFAEIP